MRTLHVLQNAHMTIKSLDRLDLISPLDFIRCGKERLVLIDRGKHKVSIVIGSFFSVPSVVLNCLD